MAPTEAAVGSRRTLGNMALAREDARAIWIWPWLEALRQDVTYALRGLRREPGFTLVALIALGSAIGLNTSLFTTFEAFLRRPWPVKDADRVVIVVDGQGRANFTLAEYDSFARHTHAFSGLFASRCLDGVSDGCTLHLDDEEISVDFVTPNYFHVLGIRMTRGAGFADHLMSRAGEPVAILSDRAWRVRFAADPGIVGRQVNLDDVRVTIVGVAASGFNGTTLDRKDLWIPIAAMPLLRSDAVFDDSKRTATLSGRLAGGVTVEQARAELDGLSLQFTTDRRLDRHQVSLIETSFFPNPGKRRNTGGVFGLMLAALLLVLGLACANVGNLLLARASRRRREMAARLALGASRARIVRQLLTESLVLAAGAAVAGVAIAFELPAALVARMAGQPLAVPLDPDVRALAFAMGLAVAACLAFGLAPALHASRAELSTALKDKAGEDGARIPLRAILLALQVAIAIVLLVSGGLIVRGVQRASTPDSGIDVDDLSDVSFELPASLPVTRIRGFAMELLDGAQTVAAGHSVGFVDSGPFALGGRRWATVRAGSADSREDSVLTLEVSAGYFDTLKIPVVAGRTLESADRARDVILINESMARRLWPDGSAVGKTVWIGPSTKRITTGEGERRVIGVVRDARTYLGGARNDAGPGSAITAFSTMYVPIAGRTIPHLVVRHLDPGLTQALAAFVRRLEPRARIVVTPVAESLDRLLASSRVAAWIAGALAILAAALGGLGVFSVFAYSVEQRTSEIGIRMALGARRGQIVRAILGSSARPLLAGLGLGVVGAVVASRAVRSFMYGLSPADPLAYAGVAAVLAVIALAATIVPARRATRIDPIVALRHE